MVDHSRSNRIIKAAHDRGDIKPPPAAVLRQRLRAGAYGSVEVLLGETLSNEQLDKLLAWAADGTRLDALLEWAADWAKDDNTQSQPFPFLELVENDDE